MIMSAPLGGYPDSICTEIPFIRVASECICWCVHLFRNLIQKYKYGNYMCTLIMTGLPSLSRACQISHCPPSPNRLSILYRPFKVSPGMSGEWGEDGPSLPLDPSSFDRIVFMAAGMDVEANTEKDLGGFSPESLSEHR